LNKNGEKDLIKMQRWPSSFTSDRPKSKTQTETETESETESLKHTKSETKTKRSKIETNYIIFQ
jgi:hypothetical protein